MMRRSAGAGRILPGPGMRFGNQVNVIRFVGVRKHAVCKGCIDSRCSDIRGND